MTLPFVRREALPARPPPIGSIGALGWLRQNLFSSAGNTAITIVAVLFLAWILPPLVRWAFIDAVWVGDDRSACLTGGACWAFVREKFELFLYGQYPIPERWRVIAVAVLFVAGLVPMAMPRVPRKGWNALYLLLVFPVVAYFLLVGGVAGLRPVETDRWGGLMVTLIVAVSGIIISLPFGLVLALGRRSRLPIVRWFSIVFIEFWRGVPLVTVLFVASVLLPVFLPPGVSFDRLLRATIVIAIFYSATMAEVIRGGLQAIPAGQHEAAMALGLPYWRRMSFVVLPQALTLVIPGIVNTFIALFKDTSLVLIIGLYDLLGMVQATTNDSNWASPNVPASAYAFAALIYWVFCFSMSRYSLAMERRLAGGRRVT